MIIYEAEGVKFPNIKKRETTSWIRQVAASYGKKVGEIGYLFVNDEKILEVNNQFLGHDYYTDIITFDYCEGKTISGDIYISVDTVFTNADKFGRPYDEELHRVIIHGILHLCGINDKGPGEREIMEAAEDKALALLKEEEYVLRKDMKRLMMTVSCCSLMVVALTLMSWTADDTMTKENGMTVINTTQLGKDVQGFLGTTPVKIYIQKNKVVKIEALKNQETPKYFLKVKKNLLDKWNGVKVKDAKKMKVDAVTGATYSSKAVIENVQLGLDYYSKH